MSSFVGRPGRPGASAPVPIVDDEVRGQRLAAPTVPARPWRVAAALARVESREWVSSPWFGLGVAFLGLSAWLFAFAWARDYDESWREWFVHMPIFVYPTVGLVVVGAHHAVTRGRRDEAEELFRSCPASESTRTAAQLLAGWVPAVAISLFVLLSTVVLKYRVPDMNGRFDGRAAADVLAAVVLGLGGSALGVALARWTPWRLAPVIAVAALVPVIGGLGNIGEPHWSNARQLSPWPRYPAHNLTYTDPPEWWHLLWLFALCSFTIWVALAHGARTRRTLVAGASLAIVVVGVGVVMTRPLSDAAAGRLASMVANPDHHQTCVTVPGVKVCVFERYAVLGDRVLGEVAPVVAAFPDDVGTITLRQAFDGEIDVLGPEVAEALDGRTPTTGFLPVEFLNNDDAMTAARLTVALDAVGLPVEPGPGDIPVVIAGEARRGRRPVARCPRRGRRGRRRADPDRAGGWDAVARPVYERLVAARDLVENGPPRDASAALATRLRRRIDDRRQLGAARRPVHHH